jgi:hypothetical protein
MRVWHFNGVVTTYGKRDCRNSWRYASLAVNRGAIKRGFTVIQIPKNNWFTRHEAERFLDNHCQECVRAYLSIHDCLSFLHEVMTGNHRIKTFLHAVMIGNYRNKTTES